MENGEAILTRRDNFEKVTVKLENIEQEIETLLEDIQKSMYQACEKRLEEKTTIAHNLEELQKNLEENQGYVKTMWCGSRECEDKVKELTGAPSRCMPFKQEHLDDVCVCCGKKADKMVVWGRQY